MTFSAPYFAEKYSNHWDPVTGEAAPLGFAERTQLLKSALIRLPPYSPELNPVENLWHYLKSHFWSNRAYADYEELEQAAVDAWQKAVLNADLMKTVCAAPYANRATSD